jgi:replication fork protection complex subunit Tof1/Swi1
VISQRRRIIEETGKTETDDEDEEDEGSESEAKPGSWRNPSGEAIAKFTDFCMPILHELRAFGANVRTAIPYKDEAQADAATNDPHFKLMFRLLKFEVQEEQDSGSEHFLVGDIDESIALDLDETQWMVPAKLMPFDMQSHLNVINQFLESPIDLQGKKASELLKKKPRKRRPRRVEVDENGEPPTKKERKKKEEQKYKSAAMIEDSDADEDEWAAFFEREKKLAERTALAAAASETKTSGTMRATGTKKRRKKGKKRRRSREDVASGPEVESGSGSDGEASAMQTPQQDDVSSPPNEPTQPARPRPRPRKRLRASSPPRSSSPPLEPAPLSNLENNDNGSPGLTSSNIKSAKKHRLVISEDEDE